MLMHEAYTASIDEINDLAYFGELHPNQTRTEQNVHLQHILHALPNEGNDPLAVARIILKLLRVPSETHV